MRLYSLIRAKLSLKNKSRLTKLLYYTGIKPTTNSKIKSQYKKGVVVFSADFEMAWAFRYSKKRNLEAVKLGLHERKNIPTFLSLFEKFDISITWATVGHLFLPECKLGENSLAHNDLPRINHFYNRNWNFNKGDWFQHDPCSNVRKDPAWYAPDLINLIKNSRINHEMACHTFSHIDCTYNNCDKQILDAELKMCNKLALEKNIKLSSFVFPGGTFGNYETLVKNGMKCYRKPMKNHIDIPYIDEFGLVVIPSSLGLDKDPYGWSIEFHKKILKAFIQKTIESKQICHFWFHPSMNDWYLENIFPFLLEMIQVEVKKGTIEVKTMGDLATDFFEL